ncbi:hypothetical protein LJC47_07615, partial [Desulfosarcina sp. OttesenSCG-928-B08]|nr:hypothetical protein [Desulfosarcina sp. OttesenSCG-928-B08]
ATVAAAKAAADAVAYAAKAANADAIYAKARAYIAPVSNDIRYDAYATLTNYTQEEYDAYGAYIDATRLADVDADAAAKTIYYIFNKDMLGKIYLGKIYLEDLALLKKTSGLPEWPDLWQGQELPDHWGELEQNFIEGLKSLGLGYWAETYKEWRVGWFDKAKLERCLLMPESVIETGLEAMLAYLQAEALVAMDEARVMFLGEGGAGKTSLINCLDEKPICLNEPATPRVAIRQRLENIQGREVRVHYWDFGGQVVMHATHQFFLREKALYVVVLDIRRSDPLEYWLDHVQTFANGSPTLIVLNKTDQLPQGLQTQLPFDLKRIRERYPFVMDSVFCLSCETKDGFSAFQTRLRELLGSHHILKEDMPVEWFRVKEALTTVNQDFIPRQKFHQICQDQKLNKQSEKTVLNVLDTLGIAVYFPKLKAHTDIVLNPEWITKAIYHIICACGKDPNFNGELSEKRVQQLFVEAKDDKDFDIVIPDDKCLFLLELMQNFKLAFSLQGSEKRYYAPMLAPINEPPHTVSRKGSLHIALGFTFLPPGLFYRFVVESSSEIVDGLIWRSGVILGQGINRLLIEYSEHRRTLECYAQGDDPGDDLNDILKRIQDIIHSDYIQLPYRPDIVLENGDVFDVEELKLRYWKEGYDSAVYGKETGRTYKVGDLLKQHLGQNFAKTIAKEIKARAAHQGLTIKNEVHVHNETNITIDITNQINLNLEVIVDAQNQVKDLARATKSFKRKNESAAVEHREQLDDLEDGFDALEDELDDLYNLQDKKAKKDDKRVKSVFDRIGSCMEGLKKIDEAMGSALGIGEKLASIADTVAKVLGGWLC